MIDHEHATIAIDQTSYVRGVYQFAAMLTSDPRKLTIGARSDSSLMIARVIEFLRRRELGEVDPFPVCSICGLAL
jgi:hypothetical protein